MRYWEYMVDNMKEYSVEIKPNGKYRYDDWLEGSWEDIYIDHEADTFGRFHKGCYIGPCVGSFTGLKADPEASVEYMVNREKEVADYNSVSKPDGINSDGGPSAYYDFHDGWRTWNDFADYKATQQWKEHSFHLGNVGKVLCRWGDKSGTSKSYDARKIVYSGLRVLLMLEGKENVRAYLENLLEDNQFKD